MSVRGTHRCKDKPSLSKAALKKKDPSPTLSKSGELACTSAKNFGPSKSRQEKEVHKGMHPAVPVLTLVAKT